MNNLIGFVVLLTGLATGIGLDLEINLPASYQIAIPGETMWFTIEATGSDQDIILTIQIIDLMNRTLLSQEEIILQNESSILVDLTLPENIPEGPYLLTVTAGDASTHTEFKVAEDSPEAISIIESSLFDIFIEIPQKFKNVGSGEELIASVKLINVGSAGRIDVFLDYTILDPEENIIFKRRETVAVETQANFVRTFDIPKDSKAGSYHILAQIVYADGKYAVADEMFEVVDDGITLPSLDVVTIGASTIAILFLFTLLNKRGFRKMRIRMKVARIVKRKQKKIDRIS